ncbi:unnamed protein product [Ixodes pacificus]
MPPPDALDASPVDQSPNRGRVSTWRAHVAAPSPDWWICLAAPPSGRSGRVGVAVTCWQPPGSPEGQSYGRRLLRAQSAHKSGPPEDAGLQPRGPMASLKEEPLAPLRAGWMQPAMLDQTR